MTFSSLRRATLRLIVAAALVAGGTVAVAGTASADPDLGILGPTLLFPESDYAGAPDGIRCVQQALGVEADGRYGQEVFDAVQAFQADHGLTVDGVVGPLTGDYILPLTPDPYFCSQYVPTTFYLYDDDGRISGGGEVQGDYGEAVSLGRPIGECVVTGVEGSIKSPFKLGKALYKRRLPTPEEWLESPNPALFTANMLYCHILKK